MARSIVVAAGTADVQATTGAFELVGVSIRETAAAAAVVHLRDGTSTAGPIRLILDLPAAAGGQVFSLPSVEFETGIFVDRTSGTTELVLYLL